MTDLPTAYSGLLLRAGLYLAVFGPTVGYYVYHDSKERKISHPRLRGFVYGFFAILGLVIHMASRERADGDERNR